MAIVYNFPITPPSLLRLCQGGSMDGRRSTKSNGILKERTKKQTTACPNHRSDPVKKAELADKEMSDCNSDIMKQKSDMLTAHWC